MEFLDNIMEFLWSFLYHIVESVWSLEIRTQNFDTTMWSFHGASSPDSGVFLFNFNTIKWNFSGVLLACEEFTGKSVILWNNKLRHAKDLI